MESSPSPSQPDRREFLTKTCALAAGAAALGIPAVGGLFVLLDPLRRGAADGTGVLVTSLGALPEDGTPRKFSILATKVDAWNRTPNVPVGAVYLRRTGPSTVQAFNVACPHAGCFVEYAAERQGYHCPCHNSTFALDGSRADPKSPSPRGLDELQVEVKGEGEVWVHFRNFLAGSHERIPV